MRCRRRFMGTLAVGAAVVVASCGGTRTTADADVADALTDAESDTDAGTNSGDEPAVTELAITGQGDPDAPAPEAGGRPTPVDIGDLSAAPFIVFAPIGPRPQSRPDSPFPDGSADYWDLFVDDAPWQQALDHVDAVKIHSWQAREHFGDQQLIDMIDFLARNEIPLIVEMEPLQPPSPAECDHNESFEGPHEILTARKIKRLGGTIAAVAIEQPYSFAHKLQGERDCKYTVERITDELILWVAELRSIFPDVRVGSIEGIWASPTTTPEDMAIWMDAYEAALGEPLAFLHMDPNWYRDDWADVAVGIEAEADARGVPFGLLYNGGLEATNDGWLQFAAEQMAAFESAAGGTPTHATFQSWVDQPDRVLPEDDLGAFTHLINRYMGARTVIDAITIDDAAGTIAGRVIGHDGEPLAGLTVNAGIRSSPDAVQDIRLTGRAPIDADAALIVVRSNSEDAIPGVLDAWVRDIAFVQGDGANRVANGDFTSGNEFWGGDPAATGVAEFQAGDGGSLRLRADVGQAIILNSESFVVDPGDDFELSVSAVIADLGEATSSGHIAVAFLDGEREVGRRSLDLVTQYQALAPAVSAADGTFVLSTGGLPTTGNEISVSTPGGVFAWPASTVLIGDAS